MRRRKMILSLITIVMVVFSMTAQFAMAASADTAGSDSAGTTASQNISGDEGDTPGDTAASDSEAAVGEGSGGNTAAKAAKTTTKKSAKKAVVSRNDGTEGGTGTGTDTTSVTVSLYTESRETEFYTGSEITAYAGVRISGQNTTLQNTTMKVTIPKKYLSSGVKASQGNNLSKDPEVTWDDDNYYITFSYKPISGGTSVELPFIFTTKNYTTPDGTTIPLQAQYYDQEGKELGKAELTLKNLAQLQTKATGRYTTFSDNYAVEGQTTTSDDPDKLDVDYAKVWCANAPLNSAYSNLGIYAPGKYRVVMKLLNGVIYDQSWQTNSYMKNATYDPEAKTVTVDVPHPSSSSILEISPRLKCPNWKYGEAIPALSTKIIPLDEDGNELMTGISDEATSYITINPAQVEHYVSVSKSYPQSYNYTEANKDRISTWNLTVTNRSTYKGSMDNVPEGAGDYYVSKIEDGSLDSHLYFDSFTLKSDSSISDSSVLENNVLYGYVSQEWVEIARNIKVDEKVQIPESILKTTEGNYRNIKLVFNDKVKLKPGESIKAAVTTKVIPQDWEQAGEQDPHWFFPGAGGLVNVDLRNNVWVDGSYGKDTKTYSLHDYSYYQIRSNGWVNLSTSASGSSFTLNQIATVTSSVNVYATPTTENGNTYMLKNGKLYMILPNGWEYINNDKNPTKLEYRSTDGMWHYTYPSPKMLYDFQGTGQCALEFDVPNDIASGYTMEAYIHLKATASTPKGSSKVTSWLSYENNGQLEIKANNNYAGDQYDLNGNGSVTDRINMDYAYINFVPPKEVVGIKLIGQDLNSLTPSTTAYRDLGDDFYYGFKIVNEMQNDEVEKLDLLDILPYVGDLSIVKNQEGKYNERGSLFTTKLTGPVQFVFNGQLVDPEANGFEIYYSTDTPENGNLEANLGRTFTKTVDDWSKVTMIRIVMKKGTKIGAEDSILLAAPAMVQDDEDAKARLKTDDTASNSFAYASSLDADTTFTPDSYIEALKTSIPITRYKVDGTVYRDYNYDGSLSKEEQTLKGVKVGLFNEAGDKIDEAETDANGYYSFNVFKRGKYSVKVLEKPDGMYFHGTVTDTDDIFPASTISTDKQLVNSKEVGNDVNSEGASENFDLEPNNREATVNSALEEKPITVPVTKVWKGEAAPVDTVDVTLTGLEQTKSLTLSKALEWKGEFANLRELGPDGQAIDYSLTEDTAVEGFTASVTGSLENGFTVKNVSGKAQNVSVTKEWDDDKDAAGKRPDQVTVHLLVNGEDSGQSLILNKDNGWKGNFSELDAADSLGTAITYSVLEEDVEGYTASTSGDVQDGFVITNTIKKSEPTPTPTPTPAVETTSVSVTKAWSDENDASGKRPAEVVIHLLANGRDTGKTLTLSADNNWKGTFSGLAVQENGTDIEYTVAEEQVTDYNAYFSGNAKDGFKVTNALVTSGTTPNNPSNPSNTDNGSGSNSSNPSSLSNGGSGSNSSNPTSPSNWTVNPTIATNPSGKGNGTMTYSDAAKGTIPKTGDRGSQALNLGLFGTACAALALALAWKKRNMR